MKKLLFLLLLPVIVSAQAVRFTNLTGAAATDSLSTTGSAVGTIENVVINTSVASDTIIVAQVSSAGATAKVIATFILGSTIHPAPVSIPFGFKVDSSYVTVQRKKTSDVTVFWRRRN